jgi:hypothetical protein
LVLVFWATFAGGRFGDIVHKSLWARRTLLLLGFVLKFSIRTIDAVAIKRLEESTYHAVVLCFGDGDGGDGEESDNQK